ncbi:hypothetical protein KXV85_004460, partial [Aspergillus fumigatus]
LDAAHRLAVTRARKRNSPGGVPGLQIRRKAPGVFGRFDSCLFRRISILIRLLGVLVSTSAPLLMAAGYSCSALSCRRNFCICRRVRTAARDLDYKPNRAASRLAGGRSFLIAHLYDNPNPSYISALHIGAARRCRELGYHLVVEPVNSQDKDLPGLVSRLFATIAPDGILLSPPLSENKEF